MPQEILDVLVTVVCYHLAFLCLGVCRIFSAHSLTAARKIVRLGLLVWLGGRFLFAIMVSSM